MNQSHRQYLITASPVIMRFITKVFLITLITISFAELLVRISGISPRVYRLGVGRSGPLTPSADKQLGYEYKKNFRDRVHVQKNLPNQTNSYGFRDREWSLAAKPGILRVAVLGDSVIDGNFSESLIDPSWGLYNQEDTIPPQLEKKLGPGFEVLNMGVNGYNTVQEVEIFLTKGFKLQPNIVLLNFVENDYDDEEGMMGSVDNSTSSLQEKIFDSMFVHSDLFRLLSVRWNFPKFKKHVAFDNFITDASAAEKWEKINPSLADFMKRIRASALAPKGDPHLMEARSWSTEKLNEIFDQAVDIDHIDKAMRPPRPNTPLGIQRCQESLQRLKEASMGAHPFRLVLTIWPSFREQEIVDVDYGQRVVDPNKQTETMEIERIAQELQIPTVRLSRLFLVNYKSLAQKKKPRLVYTIGDGMHPNPFGAETAAAIMATAVLAPKIDATLRK